MSDRLRCLSKFSLSLLLCCLILSISACNPPQRVSAQERMFRNLDLELVANYDIPKTTFKDTVVGGLSAIAYNREQDLYYVLSDDRSMRSPARFYTFKLEIEQVADAGVQGTPPCNDGHMRASPLCLDFVKISSFKPIEVTLLQDETGQEFPQGAIDPEGLAISPRNTLFISSEGNPTQDVEPFIAEFALETGNKLANLRIPERYLASEQFPDQGIQENLAFESLTINRTGLPEDPFRVFTATESALIQDESYAGEEQARVRLLHYVVNPVGRPVLLAEHLYLLEPAPADVIANGLTELLALPTEGYFLSLERTFGFAGAGAKIFQVVIGNATDTTNIASLQGNIAQVQPLRKKLLLDLADLGIYLDNLEGMTIGPRLPDGSRSLLLISDDNFNDEQVSQLLLFRLLEN